MEDGFGTTGSGMSADGHSSTPNGGVGGVGRVEETTGIGVRVDGVHSEVAQSTCVGTGGASAAAASGSTGDAGDVEDG
jgi:hypothetical protein